MLVGVDRMVTPFFLTCFGVDDIDERTAISSLSVTDWLGLLVFFSAETKGLGAGVGLPAGRRAEPRGRFSLTPERANRDSLREIRTSLRYLSLLLLLSRSNRF